MPCPDQDQTCVDSPNDGCDIDAGGADCGGICVFLDGRKPPAPAPPKCGGLAGLKCPKKTQVCVDNPRDGCNPKKGGRDCIGICVEKKSSPLVARATKFTSCGGFTGKTCPKAGQKCVDDPRDTCDPKHAADCPGICVGAACGGFAGTGCKTGDTCVDDPRDSCDPAHGGADCISVCI